MLKRIILTFCLAGGLVFSIGQFQSMHACQAQLLLSPSIPQVKVDMILKEASPLLGVTYPDACSAYQKGSLTIQEVGQGTDYYAVTLGGGQSIFIDIEDI